MDEEIKNDMDIFAELARVKTSPMKVDIDADPAESLRDHGAGEDDILATEGQLTIDVYQDEDNIYVQSAVAGVDPDELDINITKEAITIRGSREKSEKIHENNYFYQECFWGTFSRSVVLPEEVDPDKSTASLKNGILTVKMPKLGRKKGKNLKVKTDN